MNVGFEDFHLKADFQDTTTKRTPGTKVEARSEDKRAARLRQPRNSADKIARRAREMLQRRLLEALAFNPANSAAIGI